MRKFAIVVLTMGLIAVFAASAFAADAKFSGEFYLQGWYDKDHSLLDRNGGTAPDSTLGNRGSSAFYTQRLRMAIDFQVAKGLKLSTRFDALERRWMAARTAIPTATQYTTTDSEQENIGFELAYVDFALPIGRIVAGTTPSGQFGTPFGDNVGFQTSDISWIVPYKGWTFTAKVKKNKDNGLAPATANVGTGTDNDYDVYYAQVANRWQSGDAGFRIVWYRDRTNNDLATNSYYSDIRYYDAFVRQKFGVIYAELEVDLITGDFRKYNSPSALQNVKADNAVSIYFNVSADLAPATVGAMFVYSRGDDPNTTDKKEGGMRSTLSLDKSFNPCLLLWNYDYIFWFGKSTGNATASPVDTYFDNVWMYQVYGGFKVTPKLNISASYTYAYADEKPSKYASDKYGSEVDVVVKYKIYDNLEYMIGAAYLWTGDYFKGTNSSTRLENDYLITHKLTLTF